MKHVGAIVLAAGASTRLGRPKQLVTLGAENLLERSIRVARDTPCSPILVVLGAYADIIKNQCRLDGVQQIFNPDWQEGMASSIRVGMRASGELDGVLLMVCDMPAVTAGHLRALSSANEPMATFYAGRHGVPAYLPKSSFSALESLKGDIGARELLQTAKAIALPDGSLDIDTQEDVETALQLFKADL